MSDKDFKLKSSSEGFDSRSKDIFANIDSLASASKQPSKQEKSEEKQPRNRDRSRDEVSNRHKTEEFKGRESIFRSPNESGWPPARSRHDRKRQYHGNSRFVYYFTNLMKRFVIIQNEIFYLTISFVFFFLL